MKKYAVPAMMLAVFEAVAVTLWLTKDNLFYRHPALSKIRESVKLRRKSKWI